MSIEETTRIAVIGAAKWSREEDTLQVNCIDWNMPFSAINLRDYDEWVMYVDSLPEQVATGSILESLNPSYLYECLITGLRIYVLGDPRINVHYKKGMKPFLDWTGYDFKWDDAPGTISSRQIGLCRTYQPDEYLTAFSKSSNALKEATAGQGFMVAKKPINAAVEACTLKLHWLVSTRYNTYPSSALSFVTFSTTRNEVPGSHGDIIFVPTVHNESASALRAFINSLYVGDFGVYTPVWLEAIKAPGQDLLDVEIDKLIREREKTERFLEDKYRERSKLRSSLAVLYQSGPALDLAVKSLLKEMGAQITEPTKSGNEDGWITVDLGDGEILDGVLEVKSVRKATFDIGGLRQVNDWVGAALVE